MIFGIRDHVIAYFVGGFSTFLSILLSGFLINKHLQNWSNPRQQQLIIYIILMVPLFAIDSCVGLFEMHASEAMIMCLDAIKECYEAIVISCFLSLMCSLVGIRDESDLKKKDEKIPKTIRGRHIHQTFPLNYVLDDFILNEQTLKRLQFWTNQFVYIRPIVSVLSLYLLMNDRFDSKWYWITTIVLNVSISFAVSALIMFYHAFEPELEKYRTLAKFLCIKGVVFFAFWQGILLQVLEYFEIVHSDKWYTEKEVADAIQNLLICIEMGLLFAPIHSYAFPYVPYAKDNNKKKKQ